MRISVKEWDIGYRKDAYFFNAYLDGKKISSKCITADEKRGEVYILDCNENEEIKVDRINNEPIYKRLTGKVEVKRNIGNDLCDRK